MLEGRGSRAALPRRARQFLGADLKCSESSDARGALQRQQGFPSGSSSSAGYQRPSARLASASMIASVQPSRDASSSSARRRSSLGAALGRSAPGVRRMFPHATGRQEDCDSCSAALILPASSHLGVPNMTDHRPRNLVVVQDVDNPGYLWRVEWFDSDGAGYITIFAGQEAEARARDYHDAIRDGRLDSRIVDAQRGGPWTISPAAERPAQRRKRA
jgi:hypothetical protein